MSGPDTRVVEGSIWERDDELWLVEKVYEASRPAADGAPLEAVTLVKAERITNMPTHTPIENWLAKWEPYEANDD